MKKFFCSVLLFSSFLLLSASPFHDATMRKTCRTLLLQEMVKNRMEMQSGSCESMAEGAALDPLSLLIKEIGAIKGVRFSEEELELAKEKLKVLFSSEKISSDGEAPSGFIVFDLSLRVLGAISLDEVQDELDHFFDDDEWDEEDFEENRVEVLSFREGDPVSSLNLFGSNGDDEEIEDPFLTPLDPLVDPNALCNNYSELPLAEWESQTIAYIVTNMADKNVFQLLMEKKDMERKGKQINHVHPIRFIGYVFSEPKLKRAMKTIKKSTFKWDGFVNGFAARMREEGSRNNLVRFIPGFADHVGASHADIMPFIQTGDPEGLLKYLISAL